VNLRGTSRRAGSSNGTGTQEVFLPGQIRHAHLGIHMPNDRSFGISAVGNERQRQKRAFVERPSDRVFYGFMATC